MMRMTIECVRNRRSESSLHSLLLWWEMRNEVEVGNGRMNVCSLTMARTRAEMRPTTPTRVQVRLQQLSLLSFERWQLASHQHLDSNSDSNPTTDATTHPSTRDTPLPPAATQLSCSRRSPANDGSGRTDAWRATRAGWLAAESQLRPTRLNSKTQKLRLAINLQGLSALCSALCSLLSALCCKKHDHLRTTVWMSVGIISPPYSALGSSREREE